MLNKTKIAIVGGGVAGSTAALYLGELGLDITLFEKEATVSSGPPYCHLHAGGNLYREISDQQCLKLLKQSIDFVRAYPFSIDYRPTVIAVPKEDNSTPLKLLPRLELLRAEYQRLIDMDANNKVLGESEHYFKFYSKEEVEALKNVKAKAKPLTLDEWMIPAIQQLDLEKLQYPIVLVQEYGINLFRYASGVELAIAKLSNIKFLPKTTVEHIDETAKGWSVTYKNGHQHKAEFDYIINATGFRTGSIDDMLGVKSQKMVEFKASYVSHWQKQEKMLFPEIIIHGERGTPRGMGQLTPYPAGYFQLHGMTEEITLYKDGLVSSTNESAQAKLGEHFMDKLDQSWKQEEVNERTTKAIEHLSMYVPEFKEATVGAKPLFGAQQIPGDDPTLRVAEVSFPMKNYARCEIVKVSSSLEMVEAIIENLIGLGHLESMRLKRVSLRCLQEKNIRKHAQALAQLRNYPKELADRNVENAEIF
ncbi:MAG TPA: FAD-binding oxidoreductase [Campylobacterales bacterium]|nr:FAD-binding oxidoreductase [Campylobacterales bacterium]HHS93601.1 FAD-binding oxidoreductase [Campylobacterales bacterium]